MKNLVTLDSEEPRPVSKRKNTKQWCKGKVGREHQPEIVIDSRYDHWPSGSGCRQITWINREPWWYCHHIEVCAACGRHLREIVRCPDKPDEIPQRPF